MSNPWWQANNTMIYGGSYIPLYPYCGRLRIFDMKVIIGGKLPNGEESYIFEGKAGRYDIDEVLEICVKETKYSMHEQLRILSLKRSRVHRIPKNIRRRLLKLYSK